MESSITKSNLVLFLFYCFMTQWEWDHMKLRPDFQLSLSQQPPAVVQVGWWQCSVATSDWWIIYLRNMTKNLRLLEKISNFRNMHCFCCLRPYHPYFSRKYQYFLDTLSAFGRVFTHAGHSKIGHWIVLRITRVEPDTGRYWTIMPRLSTDDTGIATATGPPWLQELQVHMSTPSIWCHDHIWCHVTHLRYSDVWNDPTFTIRQSANAMSDPEPVYSQISWANRNVRETIRDLADLPEESLCWKNALFLGFWCRNIWKKCIGFVI